MRRLGEAEARRILAAGGMLVAIEGGWRAHRQRDARRKVAGTVSALIVARLESERVCEVDAADPGRRVAAAGIAPPTSPLPGPPAHMLNLAPAARRMPLAAEVLTSGTLEAGEAVRLKAAAGRFLADVEQAATPQRLTMRWDAMPIRRDARSGSMGGMGAASARALRRLKAVETAIGLEAFRQLEVLIVERAPRRTFARRCECPASGADAAALASLRALAEAYDLGVRAPA